MAILKIILMMGGGKGIEIIGNTQGVHLIILPEEESQGDIHRLAEHQRIPMRDLKETEEVWSQDIKIMSR